MDKKNEKNRGTGAGGANTNKNGKKYEKETLLSNNYKTIEKKQIENNGKEYEIIKFNKNNIKYVHLEQSAFNMYMEEQKEKKENIISAPGCCNPDDCYVDDKNKKIFIIEKKFQQTSGSVEEKIQTGIFCLITFFLKWPMKIRLSQWLLICYDFNASRITTL